MSQLTKTVDVKISKPPGWDTYKRSHLIYLDEQHRDWGVVYLNVEGLMAFYDTILISKQKSIKKDGEEIMNWLNTGGLDSGQPVPFIPTILEYTLHHYYEYLKIASAFELHVKARLLSQDVILHEINKEYPGCKDLSKKQKTSPISRSELFTVDEFYFNGQLNIIPCLTEKSLNFDTILNKSDYQSKLNLTPTQIGIIDEYRKLRNQIHLPGDIIETPLIQSEPSVYQFLVEFINNEIVEPSNVLIKKYDFNLGELPRI